MPNESSRPAFFIFGGALSPMNVLGGADRMSEDNDELALLTRSETAAVLRVHVATVDRLVRDGLLKASKWGGTVRISRAAVHKLLVDSETAAPAAPRTRRASRVAQDAA